MRIGRSVEANYQMDRLARKFAGLIARIRRPNPKLLKETEKKIKELAAQSSTKTQLITAARSTVTVIARRLPQPRRDAARVNPQTIRRLLAGSAGDKKVQAEVKRFTKEAAESLSSYATNEVKRIRVLLGKSVREKWTQKRLSDEIRKLTSVTHERARATARGLVRQLHTKTTALLAEKSGIRRFRWIHGGSGQPRPEHLARDGKVFSFDDPPSELPGELINCSCTMELLEGEKEQEEKDPDEETEPEEEEEKPEEIARDLLEKAREEERRRREEERRQREAEERRRAEEEARRKAEEERLLREAEERARREAEERARLEAEERARRAAEQGEIADGERLGPGETFRPSAYSQALTFHKPLVPTGVGGSRAIILKRAENFEKDPSDADAAIKVRRELNELLHKYKLVNRDLSEQRARSDQLIIDSMPGVLAYHGYDGRMGVSHGELKRLNHQDEFQRNDAFSSLVHENLHSASRGTPQTNVRAGKLIEEFTTEIAARKITRDETGDTRFHPGARLAYQDWISEVLQAIDNTASEGGGFERTKHTHQIAEKASFIYKRGSSRDLKSVDEVVEKFAESILEAAGSDMSKKDDLIFELRAARDRAAAKDRRARGEPSDLD